MIRRLNKRRLHEDEKSSLQKNQDYFDKQVKTTQIYITNIIDILEELREQIPEFVANVNDEVEISDEPERMLVLARIQVRNITKKLEQALKLIDSDDVYLDLYYGKNVGTN